MEKVTVFARLSRCLGEEEIEELNLTETGPGKSGTQAFFLIFIPTLIAPLLRSLFPQGCPRVGFLSVDFLHFLVSLHKAYPPPPSTSVHFPLKSL